MSASAPMRLDAIDGLRGFALFGVVISNVATLAGAASFSAIDEWADWTLTYLVTGKFLGLFTLLFGASLGLYLQGQPDAAQSIAVRYLRRMAVLFGIGMVHRVLFGTDILMSYAVLGVTLVLLRKAPDRLLIVIAAIGLTLPDLWRLASAALRYVPPPPLISRAERLRLTSEGPYLELVWIRLQLVPRWWSMFLSQDSIYLAPIAMGFWMARRRAFDTLAARGRSLMVWSLVAIASTAAGHLAVRTLRSGLAEGSRLMAAAFGIAWTGTTFLQAAAYGALFLWIWTRSGVARRWLGLVVPAGRLALTNYLSVSVITTVAVSATRMYGRIGLLAAVLAGLLLYFAQLAFSSWWLRRRAVGPIEGLWRRLANPSSG